MSRTIKQSYRQSRAWDKTCRNHGKCEWCRSNREHKTAKALLAAAASMTLLSSCRFSLIDLPESDLSKAPVYVPPSQTADADQKAAADLRAKFKALGVP